MGVYGDMLSYFPELFRQTLFWTREPILGGGYEDSSPHFYSVIVLTDSTARFQPKAATEYKVIDFKNRDVLYASSHTPIYKGMFLKHPDDGGVFILDEPLDFSFSGGYRMWGIDRVQGADALHQTDMQLKEGVF